MSPRGPQRRSGSSYSIRSVERVCDILDLLQRSAEGVSLTQITAEIGLPKSSAFRYLATLEARRYVELDNEGHYRLGLGFLPFQSRQFEMLRQRARPRLEQLRDRFDETVNFGLLDGYRVTYLDIVESNRSVRLAARPSNRDWIHSTALGKAIASELPRDRVLDILRSEGMPRLTPATITDPGDYLAELDEVVKNGYALDDCENEPDGRCFAVPLIGSRLPAAVSLSAPSSRLPVERAQEIADALTEVAQELVLDFGGLRE